MAKTQLTWTRLPQGFKNSPTLFGEALGRDLRPFMDSEADQTLLQYVDDLFLTGSGYLGPVLGRDLLITRTLNPGGISSLVEKSPNLPTPGKIFGVPNLPRKASLKPGEEAGDPGPARPCNQKEAT